MSEKVAVFDTTLRDGEQAAGTRLGSRERTRSTPAWGHLLSIIKVFKH